MSSIFNVFKLSLLNFVLGCVADGMRVRLVCETGKFTIRDAILFHKFCIFNKEYFVFLAHRMSGCKCVTNSDFLF